MDWHDEKCPECKPDVANPYAAGAPGGQTEAQLDDGLPPEMISAIKRIVGKSQTVDEMLAKIRDWGNAGAPRTLDMSPPYIDGIQNCVCWTTGSFVWVETCKFHPRPLPSK